jgi:peptidoglycan/xylan/chitin deacetylase (PgdA/CDA1 family)
VEDAGQLRRQVDEVVAHWTPIGLAEVLAAVRDGRPLPPDAVLLTFDDGRRSVLEDGLPVLRAAGVPAVLFVVAGLVGTDDPFWWDEVAHLSAGGGTTDVVAGAGGGDLVNALKRVPDVDRRRALDDLRRSSAAEPLRTRQLTVDELRELEAGGIAIGNHSLTHPILTQVDAGALRREVTESRAQLEQALGHPVTAFAYPSGAGDATVRAAVEAAGHELAFAFDDRHGRFPPPDPIQISRKKVSTTAGLSRLGVLLAGREPLPTPRHRGD